MKKSIVVSFVLPFIQWYALMIILAIAIDYFLHRFDLISVGYYFGYAGTFAIIISFIYSLRKRKIIQSGSPKKLLMFHEYLAWAGSVMLLVHAGIHFNAILPWLAILMLLISVASGLTGKYLLKKANETLKDIRQDLMKSGISTEEIDKKLFLDTVSVDLMKKWRAIHLPITFILAILVLMHIITITMYSK